MGDKVRKARSQVRRLFTVACNNLTEAIQQETFEEKVGRCHMQNIEDKASRLFKLDAEISEILLADEEAQDKDIEKEFDEAEKYRDRYNEIKIIFEDRINKIYSIGIKNESESDRQSDILIEATKLSKKIKLPKLDLVKFDGDIKKWIGFWGMFQKIHEHTEMDECDKFQYLIQATIPGSPARELVESYPPSGENYLKAVNHLKSRFARDTLLIEVYVRELLQLVFQQAFATESMKLSSLYDKLETQMRALDTLGVTSDKYAAILYPLVESALPEETLVAWDRYRTSLALSQVATENYLENDDSETTDYLAKLLKFLKMEVQGKQRIEIARNSFHQTPQRNPTECSSQASTKKIKSPQKKREIPSASALLNTERCCLFCKKGGHETVNCLAISDWSLDKKREQIKKSGACYVCLKQGHGAAQCRTFMKCLVCKKRHHTVMCAQLNQSEKETKRISNESENTVERNTTNENANSMFSSQDRVTYLQTLVVKVEAGNKTCLARAILDSGSQRSYMLKEVIDYLNPPEVGKQTFSHSLFGGEKTKPIPHKMFKVSIQNRWEEFKCDITVLDQKKICTYVPRVPDGISNLLLRRKNIVLTDTLADDLEVKLLLGADVLVDIMTSEMTTIEKGLVAVRTKLGWTIMGSQQNRAMENMLLCCTNLTTAQVDNLWRLDVLGIENPEEDKSRKLLEEETLRHFEETLSIDQDGRYSVSLPWIGGHDILQNNREMAERRLMSTTKRLFSLKKFEEYDKVLNEWENEGIIEQIDSARDKEGFFLPHHPVIKETSQTTKLRPVFDGSVKDKMGNSLNNCLGKGPNLVELIPPLLMKFRRNQIGVTADIAKAFLQIGVTENDRNFLKFLWWEDQRMKKTKTYRHRRVIFGVKSSPFLLNAVIQHHLSHAPGKYEEVALRLKSSWYVDNCLSSVKDKEELHNFIQDSTELMRMGKFELRCWTYTGMEAEKNDSVSVLGLRWNFQLDVLKCEIDSLVDQPVQWTKRGLLSVAQRIFDPVGFTCPVSLLPKLLLKEAWQLHLGWDAELPNEIVKKISGWLSQIEELKQCSVPRKLCEGAVGEGSSTLHVFADASKQAYGVCVFLRTEVDGVVSVRLVQAKSRVAPIKPLTIPRLELLAALIASRLCKEIRNTLELPICKEYIWSDSSAVITWIQKREKWSVFVENRCKEIRENTRAEDWRHIPGAYNAADLPSRGCSPKKLVESRWWEGPEWLEKDEHQWPQSDFVVPIQIVNQERTKTIVSAISGEDHDVIEKLSYFSSYLKIIRSLAWAKRFLLGLRKINPLTDATEKVTVAININQGSVVIKALSNTEIKDAELTLLGLVQKKHFDKNNLMYKNLKTFKAEDGLIRIRTRIIFGEFPDNFKYPILLPSDDPIVHRMIRYYHEKHKHVGAQTLICILREEFWILRCRKVVSSLLRKCVICQRQRAKAVTVAEAPLPKLRIDGNAAAFSTTGIDLAGPVYIGNGHKAWIVLFTCAVFRALHLELIESLSTDAFIQALRRFIARRGRVSTIFADNGTNFIGAANALKRLDWQKISNESFIHKIEWKFIPPGAPWWGGWWERLVRMVKELLRRNLGKACLSYEELYTCLCDCESLINSRPLTFITEDTEELQPLSPSLFLRDIAGHGTPDLDVIEAKSMNRRLRYLYTLKKNLRSRFKREYLSLLVGDCKRDRTVKLEVGDVVLVGSDNLKRIDWPLAKILKLYPGKDGIVRTVLVKTSLGELVRPVQKLYPLELSRQEKPTIAAAIPRHEEIITQDEEITAPNEERSSLLPQTSRGRTVRKPQRLDL